MVSLEVALVWKLVKAKCRGLEQVRDDAAESFTNGSFRQGKDAIDCQNRPHLV